MTAPKRNTEGGVLKGTGAVYVCPVNPGPCARSSYPRLYDTEGEWIGRGLCGCGKYIGASLG